MNTRLRKGFTLIELLVVIAIIAILAAILFPVFTAARESGRVTKCASNLRQISQALIMYRESYGGRNPYIWQNQMNNTDLEFDQGSFFWVIMKYSGQKLDFDTPTVDGNKGRSVIYFCPSALWLKGKWQMEPGWDNQPPFEGFAFNMNETGFDPHDGTHPPFPGCGAMDSWFKRPSQTIFIAESMGWSGCGIGYGMGQIIDQEDAKADDGGYSKLPAPDEPIPLSESGYLGAHHGSRSKVYNIRVSHNGGSNLLFYDGHTACLRMTYGRNWTMR